MLDFAAWDLEFSSMKAFVFDAFGTLFNLTLPLEEIDVLCKGKGKELLVIWRTKQLEYTWLRSLMDNYVNFDTITHEALTFAMRTIQLEEPKLFDLLMPIYRQPNCFEDVVPTLNALQAKGIQTAILSNGTPTMLQAGVEKTGLTDIIHPIISADTIGVFKPSPKVYAHAVEQMQLPIASFYFVSSNPWDIAGAGQYGLQTIWLNRSQQAAEVLPPTPNYVIQSMEELLTLAK